MTKIYKVNDPEIGPCWYLEWPNGWLTTTHPSFEEAMRVYMEGKALVERTDLDGVEFENFEGGN